MCQVKTFNELQSIIEQENLLEQRKNQKVFADILQKIGIYDAKTQLDIFLSRG